MIVCSVNQLGCVAVGCLPLVVICGLPAALAAVVWLALVSAGAGAAPWLVNVEPAGAWWVVCVVTCVDGVTLVWRKSWNARPPMPTTSGSHDGTPRPDMPRRASARAVRCAPIAWDLVARSQQQPSPLSVLAAVALARRADLTAADGETVTASAAPLPAGAGATWVEPPNGKGKLVSTNGISTPQRFRMATRASTPSAPKMITLPEIPPLVMGEIPPPNGVGLSPGANGAWP